MSAPATSNPELGLNFMTFTTTKPLQIEAAWEGGPLRKVGTGNGKPDKYVCASCKQVVVGVYVVPEKDRPKYPSATRQNPWVCARCRP